MWFPRARLIHYTPDVVTPAISPNAGNLTAEFMVVGDCVCSPGKKGKKEVFSHHFIFLELKNLKVQSALLFVFLCVFYNLVSGMLF